MAAVSIQNITRSISQVFEAIYRKVIKTFAHHLSCLFCVSLSSPSTPFQFYRANPFSRNSVWVNIMIAGDNENILARVQIIVFS